MSDKIENNMREERNEILFTIVMILWIAGLFVALFFSKAAQAQMSNEAWGFKQQNRASIAALMQQVENNDGSSGTAANSGYAGYDQLVCGSDGASSATGNSTCIILNNSNGAVEIGQDSQGNQDATSTEETTMNSLSDVLENMSE